MTTASTEAITLHETAAGEPITAGDNSWDIAAEALPDRKIVAVDHDGDMIHVTVEASNRPLA